MGKQSGDIPEKWRELLDEMADHGVMDRPEAGNVDNSTKSELEEDRHGWEAGRHGREDDRQELADDQRELLALFERLERYHVEEPGDRATRALIAQLSPSRWPKTTSAPQPTLSPFAFARLLAGTIRPQLGLWSIWFVGISVLVVSIGACFLFYMDPVRNINPFAIAAILLSGVSLFVVFRPASAAMSELEATFPLRPGVLLIGKIGWVVLYDMLLASLASILLVACGWSSVVLWQLTVSWLVPLMMSTFLAFAAILRFGIWGGIGCSAAVWSLQFVMRDKLGVFYLIGNWEHAHWLYSQSIGLLVSLICLWYAVRKMKRKDWHVGMIGS